MRRRPPISTPFPYTTLFRSQIGILEHHERRLAAELERQLLVRVGRSAADRPADLRRAGKGDLVNVGMHDQCGSGLAVAGDRKSTRLNSSHEWISYAVFCLKK